MTLWLFPPSRSGIYGLLLGSLMVLSWLIIILRYIAMPEGKKAEEELERVGWKQLPLSQRILLSGILFIILGLTVFLPDLVGGPRWLSALLLLPVFAVTIELFKLCIRQSLRKGKGQNKYCRLLFFIF
jgi:L-asparagine transporter-like permease